MFRAEIGSVAGRGLTIHLLCLLMMSSMDIFKCSLTIIVLYIYIQYSYTFSLIVLHFVVITVFISFLIALHFVIITVVVSFVGLHIGGYYSCYKFRCG